MVISINKLRMEVFPSLLVILFSFTSLGKMYFDSGLLYQLSNYGMGIIGIIGVLYTLLARLNWKNLLIIFVSFLIFALPVIHNDNLDLIQRFVQPFLYIGIGLLLINFKLNYRLVAFSFIIHALFFVVHFPSGVGHPIFADTSRNYHSVIIIYNAILVYISLYQSNMKVKLYPALLTLLICLWSLGRSGILVAVILFLVVYFQRIKSGKASTRHIKYTFSVIFSMVILYIFYFADELFVYRFLGGFLESGFEEKGRSNLLTEYWNVASSSFQNILFGVNTEGNPVFHRYGYNLHNSYLRLHSLFGLAGLLTIIILILNAVKKYWKNHKFYIMLMAVILIRISTDQAAFFGIFDPLIIYFTLNSFVAGKKKDLQINY